MTERDESLDWFWQAEISTVPACQASFLFHAYPQVDRLLKIHSHIGGTGPGRRYELEVLNKSAIVLICAFWEAFVEDLAADVLRHLAAHCQTADQLPGTLRKSIVSDLQAHKHELAAWQLADDNWRRLLLNRAEKVVGVTDRTLSTPTPGIVDKFLLTQAGMTNVSEHWHWRGVSSNMARDKLAELVRLRNIIAHRGRQYDKTVLKRQAEQGLKLIDRLHEKSLDAADAQLTAATGKSLIERRKFADYAAEL